MTLQSSGQIKLSEIATEYGGSAPHALSEYHGKGNAPGSGEIELATDFYGTSNSIYMTATGGSISTSGDYKTFKSYPAAVQPISRGLRVNVIIHKNKVSYKDKLGNDIEGWEIYDEQFINLAQNNSTVFDGHAVVANGTVVVETDNEKVLEAKPENIRFNFWDVIRYDGFIKGEDTRIGYNWRHNGIEHMIILAIDKNKTPCYDIVKADLVGSDEQLKLTVEKYKSKCVIKSLDGTWIRGNDPSQIIYDS